MNFYTYLIGWSNHNKYYYGVRFSKKSNPSELWVTYFTSSKYVKKFREEYGDPDIIQIRKKFNNVEKARLWEHKVLKKMNVVYNDKWLNKTDNKSIDLNLSTHYGIKNPMYGKKHSEYTKKLIYEKRLKFDNNKLKGKRNNFCQTGEKNNAFKYFYYTPWGKYASVKLAYDNCPDKNMFSINTIRSYCLNYNKKISKKTSSNFINNDNIGKTYKCLGFYSERVR